jgi:hypothetical protein
VVRDEDLGDLEPRDELDLLVRVVDRDVAKGEGGLGFPARRQDGNQEEARDGDEPSDPRCLHGLIVCET